MPGFERKRFLNLSQTQEEEFSCGICLSILNNPMTTPCCRQTFCLECINEWLKVDKKCPYDRKSLEIENLSQSSRIVTNILDKLQIHCDFNESGCQQTVQLSQLCQHLNVCRFNPNRICEICDEKFGIYEKHNCLNNLKLKKLELINKLESCERLTESFRIQTKCMNGLILFQRSEVKNMENKIMEMKQMISSQQNNMVPDNFKSKVLDSARINITNPIIKDCFMSVKLKNRVIKLAKRAIINYDSFDHISNFMVNVLKNKTFDWNAIVYPIEYCSPIITPNFSSCLILTFGDLCIELFNYQKERQVQSRQ